MAEIKKRGKKWQYRVFYNDPATGKQKSKSKSGFEKKSDAIAAARELEVDKEHGAQLAERSVTFVDYYEQWIKDTKLGGRYSIGAENWYKRVLDLIRSSFPGVALNDVTRRKYVKFLDDFATNHSHESVQKVNTFVRAMVRDAMSEQIIFTDFTIGVKNNGRPGMPESDKYLSIKQFKKLITVTEKHLTPRTVTAYMIYFAAFTGARMEEVAAVTWDRIDWKHKRVTLDRAYDYVGQSGFKRMKTPHSIRTIDVSGKLLDALNQLRKEQSERYLEGGYRDPLGLVFRGLNYKVPSNNAVNKSLRWYEKAAGIPAGDMITFHGLRHTHASYLLSQGIQISYISKRLGHANIALTLKVYSHLLDETYTQEAAKATNAMQELL
ncbi:site-specific integrase [Schleiferilactobacillus harbinensis]|uniref:Site-specific integrase n=1 Tax=Schleiferilactobacillus harbinensis TaxID=304207 RepID=A0ABU7T451_9LACO